MQKIDNKSNTNQKEQGCLLDPDGIIRDLPVVLTDDDGIRPAGKQDQCLYCKSRIGEKHKYDCVVLKKKVKVKYTFEIEIESPYSWNKNDIEFHRNEGSWCANNTIDELEIYAKNNGCLCDVFHCEVIDIPEQKPIRRNQEGQIVV